MSLITVSIEVIGLMSKVMNRLSKFSGVLLLAAPGLLLPGSAMAGIQTYFGATQASVNAVGGAPLAAQTLFLNALDKASVSANGFNGASVTPGSNSFGLEFKPPGKPSNQGTINFGTSPGNSNKIQSVGCGSDKTCTGRFNTTGDSGGPWWETKDSFSLTFEDAVSAFGFFATDIGDFGARVSISLSYTDGTKELIKFLGVGNSAPQPANGDEETPNGSLLFWGFTNDVRKTKKVEFVIDQAVGGSPDYIGFDDFTTGALPSTEPPPPGNVPEPATLVLVAASLGVLAVTRRRHKR